MSVVLTNNASSRLASSLTSSATSLSVTTGEGAKFPTPSGGTWFPVTVLKSSGALEIMKCTARSGDVLTVTRAQEGTAAQTFSAGDRVELRLTVAAVLQFLQTDTITTFMQQMLANDADAAAVRDRLQLGTAATKASQTSKTDTTAAALLALGAFGLGEVASVPTISDFATHTPSGLYRAVGNTTANGPISTNTGIVVLAIRYAPTVTCYLAYVLNSSDVYVGWLNGSSMQPWIKMFSTNNVSAFVQTLFDDANADAFLTTLGFSTFMRGMRDDADAATARATLGAAAKPTASISSTSLWWKDNETGLIKQCGFVSGTTGGSVTFPIAFPNACVSVMLTGKNGLNMLNNSAPTKTGFSWHDSASAESGGIYYEATGN